MLYNVLNMPASSKTMPVLPHGAQQLRRCNDNIQYSGSCNRRGRAAAVTSHVLRAEHLSPASAAPKWRSENHALVVCVP